MQFLERFGHMMSRIILSALYFVLVTPLGVVYRLFLDPLNIRSTKHQPWRRWPAENEDLAQARRQG